MITKYENKKLKLNANLRGHNAGTELRVKVDKDGNPNDSYWRNRLKDAKIDNCVEFVQIKKKKKE